MSTGEQQQLHGTDAAEAVDHGPTLIEQYGKQIAFGAIALVILFAVAAFMANTGQQGAEESWSRFAKAQVAADFANVASDFPGTEVATWARLTEGEMLLEEAVQLQFTDRTAANREFKKADEAFDAVLASSNLPPAAQERALLGKARLLEATSDGNMDDAIAAYEKIKSIPNSIYASLVDDRIEALKQEETQEFYAWFSKQSPKPEDRARPQDGLPPGHPELPVTLPPIPDELFPADWSDLKTDDAPPFEVPSDTSSSEKSPADTQPADTNAEKPAEPEGDAAPAEDATSNKPADSGKTDEKPSGDSTDDASASTPEDAAKDSAASESSTQE